MEQNLFMQKLLEEAQTVLDEEKEDRRKARNKRKAEKRKAKTKCLRKKS